MLSYKFIDCSLRIMERTVPVPLTAPAVHAMMM
jgi:hypothetical protein